MQNDENAQIHILEMLTLFWLFFMTAAFLITVHVPDEMSISVDAEMKFAGEDAINLGLATPAQSSDYDSRLAVRERMKISSNSSLHSCSFLFKGGSIIW